jgi:PKHD-type hydroxylase
MLTVSGVLAPEDVRAVRERLETVAFRDGKATAGEQARKVKANRQADPRDPGVPPLQTFVRQALERSVVFMQYARPVRWTPLIFSRYGAGETYGTHVDDTLMWAQGGGSMRSDLSFTLFLSEPDVYEGGALRLDALDGEREVKLPAGSVVLYPTGVLHRVEPVTEGERVACVGWLQSLVRREDQRELLFDLARVRARTPDGEDRLLLDKSVGRLLRMWGEV